MKNEAWSAIVAEACSWWHANLAEPNVSALMRAWYKHFGHLPADMVLRALRELREMGEMYLPPVATVSAKVKALAKGGM